MSTEPSRRYRLDIAYQGTDFNGWGRQPDQRTVQGTLEDALATIFRRAGDPPLLTVAGRTDAGVHAVGQVAHVDLSPAQEAVLRKPHGKRPPLSAEEALGRRLNGILGPVSDVVVLSASIAPEGFDARFSALWRHYEYRVADRTSLRDPLQRHRTAWVSSDLDEVSMDMGAHGLLGLHDFASYCKAREGATTIRTLQSFSWRREPHGVLIADLTADAFCHSMVRALVGACVEVGEGKLGPGDLVSLRDEKQRTSAFKVMPARGLTLLEVGYPEGAELALRAERTRALREL
ncbi:tRNA pseudouridine(38-40) synthase TruA [Leifsonia sp. fls2-241-R2A-40a]|uniref:tRNA pseudouridine(38-40) synthase TruA n=1 Tax=Leifsonia sp. fls2-241-R2A-40a TaxID=3040290 RepID=UPI00254E6F97|nr:tRNA pseudouridine(38-40) synthase TruA [Leifsonia sp. fls2-241-R2A-40a]